MSHRVRACAGFKLFGTVVNMRFLSRIAGAVASGTFTVTVFLINYGRAHRQEMEEIEKILQLSKAMQLANGTL